LRKGYAASMGYLMRDPERRIDPRKVWPPANSVIAAALAYRPHEEQPPDQLKISRYARGPDYHDIVGAMLKALVQAVEEAGGQARAYVDTGPLLERGLAFEAGLGWIGKNTCLYAPGLGSWCFIGIVLTDLRLSTDPVLESQCGDCTLCLDACPTGALCSSYELDAGRCLSYHTIENRSTIPEEIREVMGGAFFGCDRCQASCPHNNEDAGLASHEAFKHPVPSPSLAKILNLDDGAFRARFKNTCLYRPGRAGLVRNGILVAASRKSEEHLQALKQLAKSTDPVIREHALWACRQLT
ncbi:tRNA epoxyqueuosine(34) reductase QueG, partial [Acidobacteriota bacterium]